MTGGAADDEGAEEVTCTGEVVQEGDASGDEDGTAISNAPEEKDEADDSSEEDEEDEDSFEEDEEDEDELDEESPLLLSCKVVVDEVVDEADDSSADEDAEDDSLDEELDSDEEVAEDDAEEDSFVELTVDEEVVDFPSPPWEVFDEEELADEEDAAAEADSEEDAFEDEDSDVVVVTLPLHPPPVVDDVLEDEAALSLDAAEDEELLEDEDSSDEAVVDDPFPFPLEPWSVVEVVELEEVEAELLDCELAADEDEEELLEDDEDSATSEPPQVQAGVVYSERQGLTPPVSQGLQTTMTLMEVKDMPSAVSRFVDTTELLEGMLKSLPPGDLRKTITVSRQWSDVSLDVLWREVHSVATLCRGLAPVVGDHHATRFTRELEQSDWDRFDSIYASRIRTLHQKASNCVQLVDQLSRTRPRYAILPNLRSLHWNGPLVQCLTFMHPDLLVLNCSPASKSLQDTLSFSALISLAANCPKLERLGLYLGLREEDIPASDQNPQVKFNNLRTLCTGFSSVSNPRSVAFFLSFLCPWLADFVRGDSWMGEEHNVKKDGSKEWDEIEGLLPFLASVRAHERASVHRNLRRTLGGGTDKSLTIVGLKATGLTCQWKSTFRRKPNGYVAINWVSDSLRTTHRTKVIKRTSSPEWKEIVDLTSQSEDSMILFEMFDKGYVRLHSYGVVGVTVCDLLAGPQLDITFPSNGGVLTIMATKVEATCSIASEALLDAQQAASRLTKAPNAAETTVSAHDLLRGIVISLERLMGLADKLARMHPYINLAWTVASSVYSVVKNQLDRDEAIRDLLETMAGLYSHIALLGVVQNKLNGPLVDTIQKILRQTVECSLFIKEYSGNGFAARCMKQIVSTTEAKINDFKVAFTSLRNCLDTGLSVQNNLVSIRLASDIHDLGMSSAKYYNNSDVDFDEALRDKLNPTNMEWSTRPMCHPHTRVDILRNITEWIIDPRGSKVLWITALVGAGKSTIATTVANMYADTGRLGAFIFFNRDLKEQSDPTNFVRTLAYELSKCDSRIAKEIKGAVDQNCRIAQMQLDAQFKGLIRMPLVGAASDISAGTSLADEGPITIVIDALDECGNESSRGQLLAVLAKETVNLPPVVRIIITSRPEPDIFAAFANVQHIKHQELVSHEHDIRVYMESQLQDIRIKRGLQLGWPGEQKLVDLVSRADGLFIWASTACKYIDSYSPETALNGLLQAGVHKGLDNLYSKALDRGAASDTVRLGKDFQDIVGTIVVVKNPMTTQTIDKLLDLKHSSQRFLSEFASVIHQADNKPIRFFHKSFSDFITNVGRCTNPTYFIDVSHHEHRVAVNCIARMEEVFKRPLQFTPKTLLKPNYDEAVTYSCSYWIHHVIAVAEDSERREMASKAYSFMKVHILHWLEATSILKKSRSTPSILEQLYQWALDTGMDDMTSLSYDAYRFATFFAETIAEHPALITQVALPFVPVQSKLYQLFHDSRELPTVMGAYQQKWSSSLRVFPILDTSIICVSFSPDMTKVVSTGARIDDDAPLRGDENNCVRCWDVITGEEAVPAVQVEFTSVAQFSPDGAQVWVATGKGSVYILDAGTGEKLSELPSKRWFTRSENSSKMSSPSTWRDAKKDDTLTSAATRGAIQATPPPEDPTEPGDVASDVDDDFTRAAFSSDGKWVIFGNDTGELYVIDRDDKKQSYDTLNDCSRLEWRDVVRMFPSIVFSPDNEIFAAGAGDGKIYVWRTKSGERLHELEGHTKEIILLAFGPEGDKLYSASEDGNMNPYDKSAKFIEDVDEDDENDEELASKIKEHKEKYSDAPDTLITASGDIVTLVDSLPDSQLSVLEKEWQAAIEGSNPRDLTWEYKDSRIIYHHPKTIIDNDDVIKYETDGQEIWRLPLEFRHRSNDIRPNFIAFGIWNGRVFVMHLPQKLVTRGATV
ncbi:hypothetical protein EYR40_010113 [Pleurotus pulmonarius]|nr:hypothetical protein EYR36_010490 [Pleurotus pulmonarius]KAF4588560.1 hypothetical protein EYR40_010113 [Pleurotus pulmonarius]